MQFLFLTLVSVKVKTTKTKIVEYTNSTVFTGINDNCYSTQ